MTKNKILLFISIVIIIVIWYIIYRTPNNQQIVQKNDQVQILYTITSIDGTIIMTNSGQEGTWIQAWIPWEIPWVETMVVGVKIGDKISKTVEPNESFGKYYDPNKVQVLPKEIFDTIAIDPIVGEKYILWDTIVYIKEVSESEVTVDTNPEYTRQPVTYDIYIQATKK